MLTCVPGACRFIDYEYAGPNPVAFDIANHWCEWGADYHAAIPHHLDYSKFPTEEQQLRFTRAYVAAAVALKQRKEELVRSFPAPHGPCCGAPCTHHRMWVACRAFPRELTA